MKDETGGVGIEEFVGSKPKMYSFLIVVSIKKQCIWIKMFLKEEAIVNTNMFCWIVNG